MEQLLKRIIENNEKTVIYTNFLDRGMEPLKLVLYHMGIKPNMYRSISGHVKDKQSIINKYNKDPSILFLLITSAGGEGLDIKPLNNPNAIKLS